MFAIKTRYNDYLDAKGNIAPCSTNEEDVDSFGIAVYRTRKDAEKALTTMKLTQPWYDEGEAVVRLATIVNDSRGR